MHLFHLEFYLMNDNIWSASNLQRGIMVYLDQTKEVIRERATVSSFSSVWIRMQTRLGPTYLQKYAHDICIGACEWIKLRAQQFVTEFLNRDTAMLGATGIVPVSVTYR